MKVIKSISDFMFEVAEFDRSLTEFRTGNRTGNRVYIGPYTKHCSGGIYLPLDHDIWLRLCKFFDSSHPSDVGSYWTKRITDLFFIYARQHQTLFAAGYLNSGPNGQVVDGGAHQYNFGLEDDTQRRYFRNYVTNFEPKIRAAFPILPVYIDWYHLSKNFETAAELFILARQHSIGSSGLPLRVLEIGSGPCLLPLFMQKWVDGVDYTALDLREIIPLGAAVLGAFGGPGIFALPDENSGSASVKFVVSEDIEKVLKKEFDVIVNVTSFGEMELSEVRRYFDLVSGTLAPGGIFYCCNRKEKLSAFAEYPWEQINGTVLLDGEHNVSRFHFPSQVILRRVVKRED